MNETILEPDLLIREALERGMLAEAEDAIHELIAAEPEGHDGWLLQGVHDLLRGKFRGAVTAFERALQLGARRREAQLGLGQAQLGTQAYEAGWITLRDLAAREPDDPEVLHWVLRAGLALERWGALADHLRDYLERNPDDDAARFAFASVAYRRGELAEAREQHGMLRAKEADLDGLDELEALLEPETLAASAA